MFGDPRIRRGGRRGWRLPPGGYNPVVAADGRRWRDYELAAEADVLDPGPAPGHEAVTGPVHGSVTGSAAGARDRSPARGPDWFDRATRPPPLAEARPYGVPGGLARPDPPAQQDLRRSVPSEESGRPHRFPDPRGTWIRLINGDGPVDDPFRTTNAVDCALSTVSTWYGEPAVAAPRQPEYDPAGRPVLTGETRGVARAETWLGHRFEYVGQGRRAYGNIAQRLRTGGHGAAAVLITRWTSGGAHAWNAVNFHGEVIWIDAQRGHMAVEPPYANVTGVFCVTIDREGRRR
ncbi:toxin glutamine deamidase domain-containing protein [Spongiactinospora sp. TRM90649]|uniref:toxin glutamine deamidase domain-containing protein n=1 Tax=Spongiactinospora sp. TRM90649 TaxID=3031114 RepID=UPI0023F7BF55|nr:toxin glutamine deamidase domain-containing protein [Spongiactinospora sp. TRM90649]MDF5752612.1 toxin glutamine deamidase domain-containing protein [Spongiactinospora sp. TRM90649]